MIGLNGILSPRFAAIIVFVIATTWIASELYDGPVNTGPASSIADSLEPENGEIFVSGEIIIKFVPGTGQDEAAAVAFRHGSTIKEQLLLPDYYLLSVPQDSDPAEVAGLFRQEPEVVLVEPNYYMHAFLSPNDPYYPRQWHFQKIQMPQAWDLSTGNGVIVAVIDTGVAYENFGGYFQAPDLANTAFVPGIDFVNNDQHANDDHGHGTHVAGTIAQSTNNGLGVAGIAYGAKIMPVKVLNASGSGSNVSVANGIKWAADNGAKVINLSLGSYYPNSLIEDTVNYAYSRGVVVVASAGNSSGSIGYPAAYANAMAVGAIRYDETRSYYSCYGPELDLVAPGGDTRVDQNGDGFPDGVYQQTFSHGNVTEFTYEFWQGTSMAAPHVSGVAALIIARGSATTPDKVRQVLQSTARDLGTAGWDEIYGNGLVQAFNALNTSPAPGPTTVPTVTPTAIATVTPTQTPPGHTPAPPGPGTPTATPPGSDLPYHIALTNIMKYCPGGW